MEPEGILKIVSVLVGAGQFIHVGKGPVTNSNDADAAGRAWLACFDQPFVESVH